MNAGRVEQIGTQTDIYLQPQTRFVAEFIGANNGLEGTIEAVDGSGEDGRATVRVGDLTLARPTPARGWRSATRSSPTSAPRTSVSSTTARTAAGRTSWRASSTG